MEILAVRARAFGPFENETLEMGRGMNLVWGPNEAGKSSWHAAIYAGLCGMRRSRGPRLKEEREFIDRHKPWSGASWGVELDLVLRDGRRVQIYQDLDELAACRVSDLDTGTDLAARLDLIHEGTPDGARLLGLTRQTLPSTLFIRQADILRVVENAVELQDAVQRAAATGGADETAERAIQRLSDFRRENVGLRQSNSRRPLQTAIVVLDQARARLARVREAHEEYLLLADRRAEAEEAAGEAERALRACRRALTGRELAVLRKRVERARSLAEQLPRGEPRSPMEGFGALESVRAAVASFEERPPEPAMLEGPTVQMLEEELAALPDPPEGDTEPSPEVREAVQAWNAARLTREMHEKEAPPEVSAPQTGGLGSRELRAFAAQLETPMPVEDEALAYDVMVMSDRHERSRKPGQRMAVFVIGTVLLLGGAAGAWFGSGAVVLGSLGAAVLGIAAIVAGIVGRWGAPTPEEQGQLRSLEARLEVQREDRARAETERASLSARIRERGLEPSADVLHGLADAFDQAEATRKARERWRERAGDLAQAERQAMDQVWGVLQPRLAGGKAQPGGAEDLGRFVSLYEEECRTRARRAEAAARRPGLEREIAARRVLEAKLDAELEKRKAQEDEIRRLAAMAGVESHGADALAGELRAWVARAEAEIEQRYRERETWNQLQGILGERKLEDLEAELERRRGELGGVEEDPLADELLGPNPEIRLAELEEASRQAAARHNELVGKAHDVEGHLGEMAAAEEEMERAEAELARVERLDGTLERTLGFLEAARDRVQRDIAPRLREAVRGRISRITGGRYHEVTVDPATLAVKIRPRGGEWRDATLLSHGTAEQVYLLLRIALAEHLVTGGEVAPIILDDPTVQSDTARTRAFLDLLHQISRDRQIILFSQEEEALGWAQQNLATGEADRFIQLTGEVGAPSGQGRPGIGSRT